MLDVRCLIVDVRWLAGLTEDLFLSRSLCAIRIVLTSHSDGFNESFE